VANGGLSVEEALLRLKMEPFEDLGFAKLDHHRSLRQGVGEVIYGAGKTAEQIGEIAGTLLRRGQRTVLITRLSAEAASSLSSALPLQYYELGRVGVVGCLPEPDGFGRIVVATGGTSDIPVAEEAALTAEALGNEVIRLYDVGVAGLHRLLTHMEDLMNARVIVAVAGMEGALAGVIGGLVDCPVIAVPTSVGYGASFGGLAALLTMLNSCASGVSVVNIDNGFGAGYLASMINHIGRDK
jgi:NCAIR mutase (PurE)-related protein